LLLAIGDYRNGWSIGTFGAIGEFVRDADEVVDESFDPRELKIVSARGAMRIVPCPGLRAVAYDTLSPDGETWGNSIAFCLPADCGEALGAVRRLGPDLDALRDADREAILFDVGVGKDQVRMCVRTRDSRLIAALDAMEGQPFAER
jgi:hypothetical protein